MTCVNIVDHRQRCSQEVDAVIECVPDSTDNNHEGIHPLKILNNTTVEKAIRFAQRVKQPVVLFLYTSGKIKAH